MSFRVFQLSLLIFFVNLSGCSAPRFTTIQHDDSYTNTPLNNFDVVLFKSDIPQLSAYLKNSRYDEEEWYKGIAVGMTQNFKHNGVSISHTISEGGIKSILLSLNKRSINTPTMYVFIPSIAMSTRRSSVTLVMQASLFVPDRAKSIWSAKATVSPYRAADELSLKMLNELAELKIIKINKDQAETVEGLKNATFGGVLTK